MKALAVLGLLALMACATEESHANLVTDPDGGAPYRGGMDAVSSDAVPVSDAVLVADQVLVDVAALPDLAVADLARESLPVVVAQLPLCEDRDAGTGVNVRCERSTVAPDGAAMRTNTIPCLAKAADGGYFGAVPCLFWQPGDVRVYVATCEECPL